MAAVHHLAFLKMIFYQLVSSGGLICAIMQNFVEISQTVSDISRFLTRDAMLSVVYAVVSVSVCLSVCVSVTLRYCIKTAKRRITQIMPHDSPRTRFLTPKFTAKFERDHPLRGVTNAGVVG